MACIELILYFVKNSFTYEKLIFDTPFLPLGSWRVISLRNFGLTLVRNLNCPKILVFTFLLAEQ